MNPEDTLTQRSSRSPLSDFPEGRRIPGTFHGWIQLLAICLHFLPWSLLAAAQSSSNPTKNSTVQFLGLWTADDPATTVQTSQGADLEGQILLAPGKTGRGYAFSGGTAALAPIEQGLYELNHEMTLAAWIKPERLEPGQSSVLFTRTKGSVEHAGILFQIEYRAEGLSLRAELGSVEPSPHLIQGGRFEPETWHHVALTHHPDTHTTLLYLDGVRVAESTHLEPLHASQARFLIGHDSNSRARAFHGIMDDIAILDQALNQDQIVALMNSPSRITASTPANLALAAKSQTPTSSTSTPSTPSQQRSIRPEWLALALGLTGLGILLIGLDQWPTLISGIRDPRSRPARIALLFAVFSVILGAALHWSVQRPTDFHAHWDANSEVTQDSSLHRARLVSGAKLSDGHFDKALFLPKATSVAVLDRWGPSISWTLDAWVKIEQSSQPFHLIAGGPAATSNYGLGILDGEFTAIHWNTNQQRAFLKSGFRPDKGQWNHVAASYDGNLVSIYINGRLASQCPSARSHPAGFHPEMHVGASTQEPESPPNSSLSLFAAAVDEITLYHRALNSNEMASLHRSTAAPFLNRPLLRYIAFSLGFACFMVALFLILTHVFSPSTSDTHSDSLPAPFPHHSLSATAPFRMVTLILLVGFTVTVSSFLALRHETLIRDQNRLNQAVESFLEQFDTRTEHYVQQLIAARNAISAGETLTQSRWDALFTSLQLSRDYPGLFSISYAPWVTTAEQTNHEAWARQEIHPSYSVYPDLPETNRPHPSTLHFRNVKPRLPLVFESFNDLPGTHFSRRSSPLGLDWLAITNNPATRSRDALDAIRVSCDYDDVTCGGSETLYPATARTPEICGTSVYLGVNRWQSSTKPPSAVNRRSVSTEKRRPMGVLRGSFHWDAFFESWLSAESVPFGFRMLSQNLVPLCDHQTSASLHPPSFPALTTTYQVKFYTRRLHFQFHALPSFFQNQDHKWPWVIACVGSALTLGSASLVWIQIRARLQEARIAAALRHSNDQLHALIKDRERISRDLHDGTIQNIYAIGLGLKRCQSLVDQRPDVAKSQLLESIRNLNTTIAELREFILTLEPDLRKTENFNTALESLVNRLQKDTETRITLDIHPAAVAKLAPFQSIHLINIVREGLSNSLRHSEARHIHVTLKDQPPHLQLIITDDGTGFDSANESTHGNGLNNIRSRAMEINGQFEIRTEQNLGTTLSIHFPQ